MRNIDIDIARHQLVFGHIDVSRAMSFGTLVDTDGFEVWGARLHGDKEEVGPLSLAA
jgi:hypothetical protein